MESRGFWHENGKLSQRANGSPEGKNGLSEEWDEDGQLNKVENYTNGKLSEP